MKLEMDLQDLFEMLLGHMRWAMTKQTFAPYSSAEMLKRYSKHLSISQREDIVKILKQEFEKHWGARGKELGNQVWKELISSLEKKIFLEPQN